jgi:class 3 adenylate cyclase
VAKLDIGTPPRFERLLLSVLPKQVIGRLSNGETLIADRYGEVTVLFADLVGFTEFSARTARACDTAAP